MDAAKLTGVDFHPTSPSGEVFLGWGFKENHRLRWIPFIQKYDFVVGLYSDIYRLRAEFKETEIFTGVVSALRHLSKLYVLVPLETRKSCLANSLTDELIRMGCTDEKALEEFRNLSGWNETRIHLRTITDEGAVILERQKIISPQLVQALDKLLLGKRCAGMKQSIKGTWGRIQEASLNRISTMTSPFRETSLAKTTESRVDSVVVCGSVLSVATDELRDHRAEKQDGSRDQSSNKRTVSSSSESAGRFKWPTDLTLDSVRHYYDKKASDARMKYVFALHNPSDKSKVAHLIFKSTRQLNKYKGAILLDASSSVQAMGPTSFILTLGNGETIGCETDNEEEVKMWVSHIKDVIHGLQGGEKKKMESLTVKQPSPLWHRISPTASICMLSSLLIFYSYIFLFLVLCALLSLGLIEALFLFFLDRSASRARRRGEEKPGEKSDGKNKGKCDSNNNESSSTHSNNNESTIICFFSFVTELYSKRLTIPVHRWRNFFKTIPVEANSLTGDGVYHNDISAFPFTTVSPQESIHARSPKSETSATSTSLLEINATGRFRQELRRVFARESVQSSENGQDKLPSMSDKTDELLLKFLRYEDPSLESFSLVNHDWEGPTTMALEFARFVHQKEKSLLLEHMLGDPTTRMRDLYATKFMHVLDKARDAHGRRVLLVTPSNLQKDFLLEDMEIMIGHFLLNAAMEDNFLSPGFITILDLTNFTKSAALNLSRRVTTAAANRMAPKRAIPVHVHKIIFVNYPAWVQYCWAIIKRFFLPKRDHKRALFLQDLSKLANLVDTKYLPARLGGTVEGEETMAWLDAWPLRNVVSMLTRTLADVEGDIKGMPELETFLNADPSDVPKNPYPSRHSSPPSLRCHPPKLSEGTFQRKRIGTHAKLRVSPEQEAPARRQAENGRGFTTATTPKTSTSCFPTLASCFPSPRPPALSSRRSERRSTTSMKSHHSGVSSVTTQTQKKRWPPAGSSSRTNSDGALLLAKVPTPSSSRSGAAKVPSSSDYSVIDKTMPMGSPSWSFCSSKKEKSRSGCVLLLPSTEAASTSTRLSTKSDKGSTMAPHNDDDDDKAHSIETYKAHAMPPPKAPFYADSTNTPVPHKDDATHETDVRSRTPRNMTHGWCPHVRPLSPSSSSSKCISGGTEAPSHKECGLKKDNIINTRSSFDDFFKSSSSPPSSSPRPEQLKVVENDDTLPETNNCGNSGIKSGNVLDNSGECFSGKEECDDVHPADDKKSQKDDDKKDDNIHPADVKKSQKDDDKKDDNIHSADVKSQKDDDKKDDNIHPADVKKSQKDDDKKDDNIHPADVKKSQKDDDKKDDNIHPADVKKSQKDDDKKCDDIHPVDVKKSWISSTDDFLEIERACEVLRPATLAEEGGIASTNLQPTEHGTEKMKKSENRSVSRVGAGTVRSEHDEPSEGSPLMRRRAHTGPDPEMKDIMVDDSTEGYPLFVIKPTTTTTTTTTTMTRLPPQEKRESSNTEGSIYHRSSQIESCGDTDDDVFPTPWMPPENDDECLENNDMCKEMGKVVVREGVSNSSAGSRRDMMMSRASMLLKPTFHRAKVALKGGARRVGRAATHRGHSPAIAQDVVQAEKMMEDAL